MSLLRWTDRASAALIVIVVIPLLQGCVAAVGTAAVAGATAAAYDRRSAGTLVDDEVIEFKVYDVLAADTDLWAQSHVSATSFNNVVLLTGETPNEAFRQRTSEMVEAIPKVRSVHNELAIASPSSLLTRSSDSLVTAQAKTAMANLSFDMAGRTKVVTENGVVFLMGLVTRAEADAATNVARQVGGVQRVVKVFEYLD